MKRAASILLLTILLLQAGGLFFIYKIQQYSVRREMRQILYSNKIRFQEITLSISVFEKSKINSHEIFYKGEMYDIKSVNFPANNKVVLNVIKDREEKYILNNMEDIANKNNQQNRNHPNQFQKVLSLNYLSPYSEHMVFIPSLFINHFLFSRLNIVSNDMEIPSPPPKLV